MTNYTLKKSLRKTLALQVKNGELIVKAPFFMTIKKIELFIHKHISWIERHMRPKRESLIQAHMIDSYKNEARTYIPRRVAEIAKENGVEYNNVRITSAKGRWGSCTSKKNLNFSFRLILTPKEVIDYVIIHELSHIKEMNHSRKFWNEVLRMMPEYKLHEKYLKENSDLYIF